MKPAFENGSIVIVDKWAVPHRGDIVVAYMEELPAIAKLEEEVYPPEML